MTHDEQRLAPITETAGAVEWKSHLRACGFLALRGEPFDICDVRLPEPRVTEAVQSFLFAVDGVANAAMVADPERRKSSIKSALYDYMNALAWCIGVMVYITASEVDEYTDDLTREVHSARDSFYTFAPAHWDARDFRAATEEVDRAFFRGKPWPAKFAPFSFTYDAREVVAA